ncbi:hypothetical protein [Streptomyces sp. NPDC050548]|uniref:hypothetical protein n=1 Tax=Streptomyces sp. NPDC050548 TaxID=3365629 RepID=UPI0037B3788D
MSQAPVPVVTDHSDLLWAWEELAPRQIEKIAEQLWSGRKNAELAGHKMSEGRSGQ